MDSERELGRDPDPPRERSRMIAAPEAIGPFKILRQIGEGGMGVVFLAKQERPTRTVALKVIHGSVLSQRTLRRFELEAEVLARLQHPGIAQVYQVGTYSTGQGVLPYIAMEFVDGERVDVHAQRRGLPLRARLELGARIADAVQHAHAKGVIHRDLKPGNILVTAEGQPKVLDFGLARLSDDESAASTLRTDTGALMGTLTYMSPEQASGDPQSIDTRSDVYSLGVVLFELLTGNLPYDVASTSLPEAVRVIRHEEPSKLSAHDRALRGDVETIVRKALEKDPSRRYASAQALADDVRRHLADEPILARPPSTWYQLVKFTRRNRVLVTAAVAVLIALLAGVTVSTHLYLRERSASAAERDARRTAEREEKLAAATAEFLLSLFEGIDPNVARGADTSLLQRILSDARERIGTELVDYPEVEARIRGTLGGAYVMLALFDDAERELTRARDIWSARHGPSDRRTLDLERSLAELLERRGDAAGAEVAQRATLARQEDALGSSDRGTLQTRYRLGDTLMRQGRHAESELVLRETLARQLELFGPKDADVRGTRAILALVLNHQSKRVEARALLEAVLPEYREDLGDDAPDTFLALAALGRTLADLGEHEDGERMLREALEHSEHVFGPEHPETLAVLNYLAHALRAARKDAEAEVVLRDCAARSRRALGAEHADAIGTQIQLVELLIQQERFEEAEPLNEECLATLLRVYGENHAETMSARWNAAALLERRGRYREAAEHLGAIAARERQVSSEMDPDRALALYNWAGMLQDARDHAAAEPVLREALDLVERNGLEAAEFVPATRNALAKALEARGERAAADELFQAALDERRRRHPDAAHAEVAYSLTDYGEALLERGDFEAAEPLLGELVEIQEDLRREDDWRLGVARYLYGRCLAELGHHALAEAQLLPACEALARSPDADPEDARGARKAIRALYARWEAAEPGQGIAGRAERWQTELPGEE